MNLLRKSWLDSAGHLLYYILIPPVQTSPSGALNSSGHWSVVGHTHTDKDIFTLIIRIYIGTLYILYGSKFANYKRCSVMTVYEYTSKWVCVHCVQAKRDGGIFFSLFIFQFALMDTDEYNIFAILGGK